MLEKTCPKTSKWIHNLAGESDAGEQTPATSLLVDRGGLSSGKVQACWQSAADNGKKNGRSGSRARRSLSPQIVALASSWSAGVKTRVSPLVNTSRLKLLRVGITPVPDCSFTERAHVERDREGVLKSLKCLWARNAFDLLCLLTWIKDKC